MSDDAARLLQQAFDASKAHQIMTVEMAADLIERCELALQYKEGPTPGIGVFCLNAFVVRELIAAWLIVRSRMLDVLTSREK